MSDDEVAPEPAIGRGQRLPSRTAIRDGLLTLAYLAMLVVGSTLLVTLELVGRH
ncbi:MAG: hypothetical protein ACOCP2_01550 [Halohasta sp.]